MGKIWKLSREMHSAEGSEWSRIGFQFTNCGSESSLGEFSFGENLIRICWVGPTQSFHLSAFAFNNKLEAKLRIRSTASPFGLRNMQKEAKANRRCVHEICCENFTKWKTMCSYVHIDTTTTTPSTRTHLWRKVGPERLSRVAPELPPRQSSRLMRRKQS